MPQEPRAGNQEPKAQSPKPSPKPCTSRRARQSLRSAPRSRQNRRAGRGRAAWWKEFSRRVRPSRLGRRSRRVRAARQNAPRSRQNRRGTRFAPRPFLLLRRLRRGGLSFRCLFRQSRRVRPSRQNAPLSRQNAPLSRQNAPLSRQNAPRSRRAFFPKLPKRLRPNSCCLRAGQGRGARLPGRLAPSTGRARLFLNLGIIPHRYLQGSGPRPSRKWNSTAVSAATA